MLWFGTDLRIVSAGWSSLDDVKPDNLNVQRVGVQKHHFPSFFEFGHGNQCDRLPVLPFDDCRFEFRLVSDKEYMWTGLNDERILFLIRITPC